MVISRGKPKEVREKLAPVSFHPSKISHEVTWD
jgi:hypothetical protein